MPWHEKHFPTFKRFERALRGWSQERDLFEHVLFYGVIALVLLGLLYWYLLAPPIGFPAGAYIEVPEGSSLASIATLMQQHGVVTYGSVLKDLTRVMGSDKRIEAGEYYFPAPQNAVEVALRLTSGDFDITPVKVTVPEGSTVQQIADLLYLKVPGFNKSAF